MDYSKKTKEELIEKIENLTKEKENIHNVLNNIDEMFYIFSFLENGNRNIDYLSTQVEKILGLSVKEYVKNKNNLDKYFHPEDLEKLYAGIEKITKNNNKKVVQYRFYNKKLKKYVWIEEKLVCSFYKSGKIKEVLGTAKNITKEKEKENQLALIIGNISEYIYSIKYKGKNKKIVFVSPHIKKLTGLTPEEFEKEGISGKLNLRIHPEDLHVVKKTIDNLHNKKKDFYHSEYRFKPKGKNNYLWLEEELHVKFNEKGFLLETITVLKDKTKQKQQQELLKQSNNRFQILSNATNEVVLIHEKGKILDINNSVKNIFGYEPKELIGKKTSFLAAQPSVKTVTKSSLSDKNTAYEGFGFKKNGTTFHAEVVSKSMNFNGKIIKIVTVRDVSRQKIAENHLKENQEKYRNLFSKNLAGVFIIENNKITECNNAFAKIFGYKSRVELIGLDIYTFYFNEKDRNKYLKDLKKQKKLINYKIRHKKKDGSEIWILTNVTLLKNNRIEGSLIEITEEIKTEELQREKFRVKIAQESNKLLVKEIREKEETAKKLLENQKYTKSIINNSLDIICASNTSGKVIEFNRAAENAFGYKQEEIINKNVGMLYASKNEYLKVSKQLKKEGRFVGEINNKRKNGQVFTTFLSASVLYNNEGNPIGTMGISRDITELKEAEKQLIESEEKYRDLFENASDLIQSVDKEGNIIYVNNAWKKTLGYTDKEIVNKNIFDFIHTNSLEQYKNICEKLSNKRIKSDRITFNFITKREKIVKVEGGVTCKKIEGKLVSTRFILRDITEEDKRKQLQIVYNKISKIITETVDSEKLYEKIRVELGNIFDTSIFAIAYLVDEDTLSFPFYYDTTRNGRIFIEKRKQKKGLNEYIIKGRKSRIMYRNEWKEIVKKEKYNLYGKEAEVFVGVPLKIKNKVVGLVSVQSYNNKNAFNEHTVEILEFIAGALALAVQRKYDENLIYKQSARLNAIIESSSHLFWTYDKKKGLTSFNQNFSDAIFELYGKRPTLKNNKKNRVGKKSLHPFWDKKYNEAFNGSKVNFITERVSLKKKRIIREVFLSPIFNEKKEVILVSGIAHDITDKKIAEEKLKESLKEKEVLLKEVHHRVKNNLQVISSILNLQSSYIEDVKTLSILKESQNRIKSMAFIHESLYQTNDLSKINFSEYVVTLSKNLVHSYRILSNSVVLNLDINKMTLSLDLSIPCGLIINELVSNALKYAFTSNKKGVITIKISCVKNTVTLIIGDNGIGLPNNVDYKKTDSLGLQLVITLVEQINGTIELDNEKGAKYKIVFKK